MERQFLHNSTGSAPPPPPGYPVTPQNVIPASFGAQQAYKTNTGFFTQQQQRRPASAMDSGFVSPDMFVSHQQPIHRLCSTPAKSSNDFVVNMICENDNNFANSGCYSLNSAAAMYPSAGHAVPQLGYSTPPAAQLSSAIPNYSPMHQTPGGNYAHDASNMLVGNTSSNGTSQSAFPPHQIVHPPVASSASRTTSSLCRVYFSDPPQSSEINERVELMKGFAHWPRLPEFKPHNPELWFTLVESIFKHCKMDDSSKFLCLMTALSNHENLIIDLVGMPEAPDRYERAKSIILHRLGRTVSDSVRKILHGVNMGKHTPSELWRYLRSIARPAVISDDALRTIWQDKLPAHVGLTLSNAPYAPLEQTLESADNIFASYKCYGGLRGLLSFDPGALYKVEQPDSGRGRGRGRGRQAKNNTVDQAPGTRRNVKFAALPALRMPPSPDYSSESSGDDPPPLPPSPQDGLPLSHRVCYYHYYFGASAKQCRPPCQHPNARRE